MTNKDELRALAVGAKGWNLDMVLPATDDAPCKVGTTLDGEFYELIEIRCEDYYKSSVPLANYFAAMSPDTTLALLDEIVALKAELGDLPEAQADMLHTIKQLKAEIAVMRTQMIDMSWVCNKCGKWSEYCHCVKALHAAPGSKP